MFCSSQRSACSLARAPYCTVIDWSILAVAVARAGVAPFSPVYHDNVLAGVPGTNVVDDDSGPGPPTRSGGLELKKLSDAVIAEVSAVCRFAAVTALVAPIANELAGSGLAVDAVSVMFSLVPSGKLNL